MANQIIRPHINSFPFHIQIDTRWMDNDVYGHVNNVVYYSYFDTIVNRFLIENAGLDIHCGEQIGLMVQSNCNYFESIAFPDKLIGGFAVSRIGKSSVDYQLAIFKENTQYSVAQGAMTHVFVDRESRKPHPIEGKLKQALASAISQ